MNKIAFAALVVLGLVLGTLNFAAPAHAANYYYGMSSGPRHKRRRLTPSVL